MKFCVFIVTIFASMQMLEALCPQYWYQFRNKCFYHNNTVATTLNNFELCASLNATLVSIHSEAENEYLKTILDSTKEYWTGGVQVANTLKAFEWTDGSAFNYSNWHDDQPNEESDYFCVAIVFENGHWYDRSCTESRRQLCQKLENMEMKSYFQKYPQNYINGLTENQKLLIERLHTVETQLTAIKSGAVKSAKGDYINEYNAWNKSMQSRFSGLIQQDDSSRETQLNERLKTMKGEINTLNATIGQNGSKHENMDTIVLAISATSLALSLIACIFTFCSSRKHVFLNSPDKQRYHRDSFRNTNIYDDIQLK